MGRDSQPLAASTVVSHRPDVVRRLMDRGLSPRTLSLLLPEWSETIAVLGSER
ncbi:MAG TPA: hypothetical protein VGA69_00720 [Nitriliruptorales bacterium]